MSDCLAYWKSYWGEPLNDRQKTHFEWHTNDEHFHQKVRVGDSLWVITTGGSRSPEEWRLVMRISIQELDNHSSKYGRYHALGNSEESQLFDINAQGDLAPLLQELEFLSGKFIKGEGRKIGNEIQAIRPLSKNGSSRLENYAKILTLADKIDLPLSDVPDVTRGRTRRISAQNTDWHRIVDREITLIRKCLSGNLEQLPINEKICDWIHFLLFD